MTHPRRLLPDQTHSITRRVIERRFLLRPSPFVNAVILYSLARAQQLYSSVLLHAFVAESNHTHADVTDTRKLTDQPSELPRFFASVHRMVSAALNTHYGRGENLWASGSFHNTEVHGELSTEQQLLYTILRLTDKQPRRWADEGYPACPALQAGKEGPWRRLAPLDQTTPPGPTSSNW